MIKIITMSILVFLGSAMMANAQCGGASWYSLPGNRTANGEKMNPSAMTAAHKTLKFGTMVRVIHKKTGKSVTVRINDRGPFIRGRIIDLSKGAAKQIGMIGSGHANVCIATGGKTSKTKTKVIKKVKTEKTKKENNR